jgi:hypothetical protein
VQFLRPLGNENWIPPDSSTGAHYSFDDELDNSISASLTETPAAKRPTQAAFLRSLPALGLLESEVEARKLLDPRDPKCHCAICREAFCAGYAVTSLPCRHEFHHQCIVQWLQSNCSCPICRHRLPEATEDEEEDEEADGNCEDLLRLKRPSSAATAVSVVGVPASESEGTPAGATAEGVPTTAQGSAGADGLQSGNATSSVVGRSPVESSAVESFGGDEFAGG